MKSIRHSNGTLHVETPLGIVNIRVGLSDSRGRRVDSIELIPNRYVGEKSVRRSGFVNSRFIEARKAVYHGR